jgi:hypothetical protein
MMHGVPGRAGYLTVLLVAGVLVAGHGRGIAAEETGSPRGPASPRGATVALRGEDHANFGRIDIEADKRAHYRIVRDGDHLYIHFDAGTSLSEPDRLPRNVQAAKVSGAVLELTLAHGAAIHPLRTGGHIIFDVYDLPNGAKPPTTLTPPPLAKAETGPRMPVEQDAHAVAPQSPPRPEVKPVMAGLAASPELGGRATGASFVQAPIPPPAAPRPPVQPVLRTPQNAIASAPQAQPADKSAPSLPTDEKSPAVGRDILPAPDQPAGLIARRVRLPADAEGTAVLLPFDATTGAAAFQAGETAYVVFDQRRQVSLTLLQNDPVFRNLTMRLLPVATLFQLKLPPGQSLSLALVPQGWRLFASPTATRRQAIPFLVNKGQIELPADRPGTVVSLADPESGATLLVGTQRRPGQAVTVPRHTMQFILRQAIQGVVVEPLADSLQMQSTSQGFTLSGSAAPLMVSPITPVMQASIAAANLSRMIDLPLVRPETLLHRLEQQFLEAGATPPLSRGPIRRAAAESLVSLGFAAEADSLLQTVAAQDPQEAATPSTEALMGMTALLAGRPNEAELLNDPKLDGTDEIDFWRAVRRAMADEGSPPAAAVFANTGALVLAYPKPIAEHFLPLVVETMLLGGEIQPAARLMDARPNDPRLAYARALRREADGDTDGALAMLDQLTLGRDQFDRLRGAVHGIELRLKAGRITTEQAADGLDKLLIAWRGDDRELALRERIADLRARTGAWRTGLSILRDAEDDFPERVTAIQARLQDMFGAMMRDGAMVLPPLDFVSTVDENIDLMPRYESDPAVQQAMLDRLIALDLPDRAIPLLQKLVSGAVSDVVKARYGATLAAIQDREGQTADALATLDATETEQAPDNLAEGRILTRASAMAHGGDRTGAIKLLTRLATAAAAARRAELQEGAGDWTAAEAAWRDALAASSAASPAATAHTLVRLAAAASRAGDDAGLQGLRDAWLNRLPSGPDSDAFRLLTAAPVRSAQDLQRSADEVHLAASLASAGKPGQTAK